VIRTDVVDAIERATPLTRFPKALAAALRFRSDTGTSLPALVREGLAMRRNQDLTWAQLALAANAPMLIKASMVDGKPDVGVLPTGQVAGVIDELPTVAEVIDAIVREAVATLDRLAA
jgi:NAD(P)H-dependent flavin oxidoreductase YrpB (nitropropane dioxygenase family)